MGYLGHPTGDKGFYRLDTLLVDWILEEKNKLSIFVSIAVYTENGKEKK